MRFSTSSSHYANTPALSMDRVRQLAPSIFAVSQRDTLSDRYTMIPTSAILEGLIGEGFLPVQAAQHRTRLADRKEHAKHMIRMRHSDHIHAPAVVDAVVPEIVILNSHDGSSSYQIHAGMFRFVCANGMVVADTLLQRHCVRHTGDIVGNVIEAAYEIVKEVPALSAKVEEYRGISLNDNESLILADAALSLRYDAESGEHSPIAPSQLLRPRRSADTANDLWSRFNVIQENMLRGGLRGRASTGKRTTTREVQSIDKNVYLNKALWRLVDEMAKLKAA